MFILRLGSKRTNQSPVDCLNFKPFVLKENDIQRKLNRVGQYCKEVICMCEWPISNRGFRSVW